MEVRDDERHPDENVYASNYVGNFPTVGPATNMDMFTKQNVPCPGEETGIKPALTIPFRMYFSFVEKKLEKMNFSQSCSSSRALRV